MTVALDLTLAAIESHGWRVVLLQPRAKKPPEHQRWPITTDLSVIRRHSGNRGLVCGQASGVAVLDFDDRAMAEEMRAALGPLTPWTKSGSGRGDHCYVGWEPNLPARITWRGVKVGEVQRGDQQQVVLPPSIHPGDSKRGIPSGGIYQWLIDPRQPLPTLPDAWRGYLLGPVLPDGDASWDGPWGTVIATGVRPSDLPTANLTFDETPWDGPSPEELIRRAMKQPGASRRSTGVKFQCPGCRAEGHDKHMDNAIVYLSGRWGCAVDSRHSQAIAEALGVTNSAPGIPGYDPRLLRQLGVRL